MLIILLSRSEESFDLPNVSSLSIRITLGEFKIASSKNCANFVSDCPYNLLKTSQPLMFITCLFNEWAMVLAKSVFPVPEMP